MLELCRDYAENVQRVSDFLHTDENFDLIRKELVIGGMKATFFYIDGFVDGDAME